MFAEFNNVLEVMDFFKDEETCLKYWEYVRWGDNITCIHCNHDKVYVTNRGYKCATTGCGRKFSALVGTIFENTKLPLRTWFAAIFLISTSKKGISATQFAAQFNIGLKAAWHLFHRIRTGAKQAKPEELEGTVQIDETFVGGKNKNRHWNKKSKGRVEERMFIDKTPVLGMLEVDTGKLILVVVPDTKTDTLIPQVKENVAFGSTVYTDEWMPYNHLKPFYIHEVVEHSRKQYVKGEVTTNAVENVWSTFKKGMIGIYQWVHRRHLQKYCDEFMFRYNHRHLSVVDRFIACLKTAAGVRLRYADLIN